METKHTEKTLTEPGWYWWKPLYEFSVESRFVQINIYNDKPWVEHHGSLWRCEGTYYGPIDTAAIEAQLFERREGDETTMTKDEAAVENISSCLKKMEQQEQTIAALREALLPFARLADKFKDDVFYGGDIRLAQSPNETGKAGDPGEVVAYHNFLTLGDCRKASLALSETKNRKED